MGKLESSTNQGLSKGSRVFWEEQALRRSSEALDSLVLLGGPEFWAEYRDKSEKRLFGRVITVDRTMNVLDIGCGTGRWEIFLASRCRKIIAFDFSQKLLDIAQKRLASAGFKNVTLVCSSLENYNTEDKFDLAIISSVLSCVADEEVTKLVEKLSHFIRPGGKIFSLEFTGLRSAYKGHNNSEYIMRTREQLVSFFGQRGFDLVEEGYAFPPLVVPYVVYGVVVPDRIKEKTWVQNFFRFVMNFQYAVIDPIFNNIEWVYRPLLFFKRSYPVHHRWYLYNRRTTN